MLRVFENKVLRRVFELKRDEVKGEWIKLRNAHIRVLYSLPNIVRVVKSSRVRWAWRVARMGGERYAQVSSGETRGKEAIAETQV